MNAVHVYGSLSAAVSCGRRILHLYKLIKGIAMITVKECSARLRSLHLEQPNDDANDLKMQILSTTARVDVMTEWTPGPNDNISGVAHSPHLNARIFFVRTKGRPNCVALVVRPVNMEAWKYGTLGHNIVDGQSYDINLNLDASDVMVRLFVEGEGTLTAADGIEPMQDGDNLVYRVPLQFTMFRSPVAHM